MGGAGEWLIYLYYNLNFICGKKKNKKNISININHDRKSWHELQIVENEKEKVVEFNIHVHV